MVSVGGGGTDGGCGQERPPALRSGNETHNGYWDSFLGSKQSSLRIKLGMHYSELIEPDVRVRIRFGARPLAPSGPPS